MIWHETLTLLARNDKSEIENSFRFSASHHFKKSFIAANRNNLHLCMLSTSRMVFVVFKSLRNNKNFKGVLMKHKNAAIIYPDR